MADCILLPICLNCNSTVARGWNKYCSRKCHRDYRRSELSRQCDTCGIYFTPIRFVTNIHGVTRPGPNSCKQTCSDECYRALLSVRASEITGSRKGGWKGGVSADHNHGFRGTNWPSVAERMRRRDGYSCKSCGLSNSDHKAKYGKALEVHHKIPFHNFTDHVKANRPSNLVSLCAPCHRKAEGEVPALQLSLTWSDHARGNRSGLARGERHGQSRLTAEAVMEMRKMRALGDSVYRIAKHAGVAYMTAKCAIIGKTWAHLPM